MWIRRGLAIAIAVIGAVAVAYSLIGQRHGPPLMALEFAIPIAIVYVAASWNRPRP